MRRSPSRREALQVGALSLLGGMHLPNFLAARESQALERPGRAKNVILLYLLGGAATQDMVDLKPSAPTDIRGEFRPLATRVPGFQVSEHLPRMARWAHRIGLVRSLNHRAGCHNPLPSYTGQDGVLPDIVSTRDTYPPSMGSVCEWLRERAGGDRGLRELPDYVYLPCYLGWGQAIRRPGPYGGFLGKRMDPLFTEVDPRPAPGGPSPAPGRPVPVLGEPRLPDSTLAEGVTPARLAARRSLVADIETRMRELEGNGVLDRFTRTQRRAYDILTSTEVRGAFDLRREDPRLRDRYGRTLFGNCALIARRLVEADVRFVNVTWDLFWDRVRINYDSWDTHTRNFPILREVNLPEFDRVYDALLTDLDSRGLLDETLVVVMSEMGRTPRINANGGRDHWTHCYSMWFAGGGIRGGTIVGASDGQAGYVKDRPISPADVCCTIYDRLGIDPHLMVPDRSGRPVSIGQGGQVIGELI